MTVQIIKAEKLLFESFSHIYSGDGYQWKLLVVKDTSKMFVAVELLDEMGFGYKSGTMTKRIKKTALITVS